MSASTFATKYNGQSLANNNGYFVGECVSLAARYAQEDQKVPNADAVLYCQKTGGARDLYEAPTTLLKQHYDLIPYGQPRKVGDLVVWGANLGKYGDVAIALDEKDYIFGQLGTPVFIKANKRHESRPPLGYLRLKGEPMNPNHVKVLFQQFVNKDPSAKELADYVKNGYGYALTKLNPARKDLGTVINQRDQANAKVTELTKAIGVKDKEIASLKAQLGNSSDANVLGQALIALMAKFGYRK